EPLAMYVHIPFCEALCYYCGCNIQITKDSDRAKPYIHALKKEIETTARLLGERRQLSQISWGGGTPTFLSEPLMESHFAGIREHFDLAPLGEVSIEIDPRVTTQSQLDCLRKLGFNRVSLGLQDFSPEVQKAVNREQPYEMTRTMVEYCRRLGFKGINIDLIYGLPLQTLETFNQTVQQILSIRPDRIALYNYAHLPSLRPHQKILEKFPMPSPEVRTEIFLSAFDQFTKGPYRPIGMDHFAVEEDELFLALPRGDLYRNFMGYTVARGAGMIGIGASAIGELGGGFFQNIRETKPYEERVEATGLSTFRGCLLSEDDLQRQWVIQRIMCRFELKFEDFEQKFGIEFSSKFSLELSQLPAFAESGVMELSAQGFRVTPLGRVFVRNIAMLFDAYLRQPKGATYSQTV
ncbi:MAG: oxygen-independent coproporphyrinogen III oxidase, partial [Pseudobdellovibrionaceae bacterium]